MKKFLIAISSSLAILLAMISLPLAAHADSSLQDSAKGALCQGSNGTANGGSCTDSGPSVTSIFSTVTNVTSFVAGSIAVIMIVIGGVRYATSGGDEKNVKAAKNTILYAIVGLVVVVIAYAVVNFVLQNVK